MTTPRELVLSVAMHAGVPESTVTQHDRNLSVAGMRTMGGRGRSAARVTYQDAANLLIAVAGSRNVKDSVATVNDYAGLVAEKPLTFVDDGKEVVRGEIFADALAALLESVPDEREKYSGSDGATIDVFLYGPKPSARIQWQVNGKSDDIAYQQRGSGVDRKPWQTTMKAGELTSDLQFISKFTQVTIGHVGTLLKE